MLSLRYRFAKFQKLLRSRSGSYIAEAAVVLPVVIIAIVTVVLILMFFYEQSVNRSSMHMVLRREALEVTEHEPGDTGNYSNIADPTGSTGSYIPEWDGSISTGQKGVFKNISGCSGIKMIGRGLLSFPREVIIEGSWHASDGVAFKRSASGRLSD